MQLDLPCFPVLIEKIKCISRKIKIFKNTENNLIYFSIWIYFPYIIGTQITYLQAFKYYIGLKNEIKNMYISIFDKGGHFLRLWHAITLLAPLSPNKITKTPIPTKDTHSLIIINELINKFTFETFCTKDEENLLSCMKGNYKNEFE